LTRIVSPLLAVFLIGLTLFPLAVAPSFAATYTYGKHYPQGNAAVDYVYGANGMWKHMNPAEYIWNYYSQYATPNHPYDRNALIAYANGTHFTTARDANGHLLLDFNHDGEIDVTDGGFAFHEHNGKGAGGVTKGNPFTNFWFDDNWLARYLSNAYGRTPPNGLSAYTDFTRWQIVGGDTSHWTPYGSDFFDTLALDGLYYLSIGNVSTAVSKWDRMVTKSGATWDGANQRYSYPNITENYHMGLFKVLCEQLRDVSGVSSSKNNELLQHSISLRSNILSLQEKDGSGAFLGWRSSITDANSLINTESVTCGVIALGANAKYVFEAGRSPLSQNPNNYFLRPHNVLSAVNGLSTAGYMTYGPYWNFPTGAYKVEYYLRAPSPSGTMATLDVRDNNNGQILGSTVVNGSSMNTGNTWTRVTLNINVSNPSNSLEFRTYWNGGPNMDVACIRVR
jgi:hypothetical protein